MPWIFTVVSTALIQSANLLIVLFSSFLLIYRLIRVVITLGWVYLFVLILRYVSEFLENGTLMFQPTNQRTMFAHSRAII